MNTILILACLIPGQAEAPNTSASEQPVVESSDYQSDSSTPADTTLKVSENSPLNSVVGSAASGEEPSASSPSYEITSGNDNEAFSIEPGTGEITVQNSAALDFESRSSFELTVEITTSADPNDENQQRFIEQLRKTGADEETIAQSLRNTTERVVRIEVVDVNESPLFEEQPFRMDGNSPAGTVIGSLKANDPDHGDELHFSIADETTERVFAVDAETGVITLHDPKALHEWFQNHDPHQYQATFHVQDRGGLVDVTSVTISIDPVYVAPPVEVVETTPAKPEIETPSEPMTTEPEEAHTAAEDPIVVPMVQADPSSEIAESNHQEAAVPESVSAATPPVSETVETSVSGESSAATAQAAGGSSGWFSRFLNLLFLGVLAGAGLHLFKRWKTQQRLLEHLQTEATRLNALSTSLEGEKSALENVRAQFEQEKKSLSSREEQVTSREKELESRHAELTNAAERLQQEQESLASERQKIQTAFEEIERHEQDLAERKRAFEDASQVEERTETTALDVAEQLVDLAAENELPPPEVESEEVLELRNRLAEMFGVSESESARHSQNRPESEREPGPSYAGYDGIVKADKHPSASGSSRETSGHYEPSRTAVADEPESTVSTTEQEPDSVASYMQALLERERVRKLYGSSGATSQVESTRPVVESTVKPKTTPAKPPVVPVVEEEVEPPKPISETPIHPQDKVAVRDGLSSLREVANQAARSAVLKHAKKKLRNHSLIKISTGAAAFLTAGVVFSGSIPVTSLLGWAAVGIGAIILVDLAHWTYVSRQSSRQRTKNQN